MKRGLLAFCLVVILTSITFSQNLSVSHHGSLVQNGATIDVSGNIDTVVFIEAKVHNNGASTKEVKIRKEEISLINGSMNTFCFAGQCYGSSTLISVHSVQIAAGLADSSFVGDYYPLNNPGTSIIRYTYFDMNNVNDSVSFTVRFTGSLGISQPGSLQPEISSVYPNPATDRVFLDFNNPQSNNNVMLILSDFAGRKVREIIVPAGKGKLEVDLSSIENGVYFYSIIQDNQLVQTRKLVVKK